jgi:hypothetical protein
MADELQIMYAVGEKVSGSKVQPNGQAQVRRHG